MTVLSWRDVAVTLPPPPRAAVGDAQERLMAWGNRLNLRAMWHTRPALLSRRINEMAALGVMVMPPVLDTAWAFAFAQHAIWVWSLDEQFDQAPLDTDPAEVAAAFQPLLDLLQGDPRASALPGTPTALLLTALQDHLATVAACRPAACPEWMHAYAAALAHYVTVTRDEVITNLQAARGASLPDLNSYLNQSMTTMGIWTTSRLLSGVEADPSLAWEQIAQTLPGLGTAMRIANDLATDERERAEGKVTSLSILRAQGLDDATTRATLQRRLSQQWRDGTPQLITPPSTLARIVVAVAALTITAYDHGDFIFAV